MSLLLLLKTAPPTCSDLLPEKTAFMKTGDPPKFDTAPPLTVAVLFRNFVLTTVGDESLLSMAPPK